MNTRLRIDDYGIIYYSLGDNIGIDIFEQGGGSSLPKRRFKLS